MGAEEQSTRQYQRGAIRSREYASQLRNFVHLRWGAITPSDIDLFLDFDDRLFIIVEAKYNFDWPEGVKKPKGIRTGQKLALERLCDASASQTRTSILMLCSHSSQTGTDIEFSTIRVVRYRLNGQWWTPKTVTTLLPAIEHCRKRYL